MPAWWLGSSWALQGEGWGCVQLTPCGLAGDPHHPWHSPAGEAALGVQHRPSLSPGGHREAQNCDQRGAHGHRPGGAGNAKFHPGHGQGPSRKQRGRGGRQEGDNWGQLCPGTRQARGREHEGWGCPLLGAKEGTAGCCISSSMLPQASCCCEVRLRDCQGTAGTAGMGTQGARGSSALKTEPPACCYLLNNRGAGGQPERNVIPESLGRHLSCWKLP